MQQGTSLCEVVSYVDEIWQANDCVPLAAGGSISSLRPNDLTIFGSDNGFSHDRCQAIIWTNAGILFIGPLGINFIEILIEIQTFSFKKMHLKMSSGKWWSSCLGLNVFAILTNPTNHKFYAFHQSLQNFDGSDPDGSTIHFDPSVRNLTRWGRSKKNDLVCDFECFLSPKISALRFRFN